MRSPVMLNNDWKACEELSYFMYEKDPNIQYPVTCNLLFSVARDIFDLSQRRATAWKNICSKEVWGIRTLEWKRVYSRKIIWIYSKHNHNFCSNSEILIYNRSTQLQSIISLVHLCSFQTNFSDTQNAWVSIFHMFYKLWVINPTMTVCDFFSPKLKL